MSIQVVSTLPNSPDVQVTLTGLLLMRFDKNGFRAGIVQTGLHQLRIAIELQNANRKVLQKWAHNGPLTENLQIEVVKPMTHGINVYQNGAVLNREKTPSAQKKDFRWVMDLQLFHEKKLRVNPKAVNRAIYLNHGTFFANKLFKAKSPLNLSRNKPFQLSKAASDAGIVVDPTEPKAVVLRTLSEIVGANIYLKPDGGKVRLRWGKQGNLFPDLPKPKEGERYKIIINNDCCFGEEPLRLDGRFSDLPMYYDAIENVPKEEILDLLVSNVISTELPCIPVLGGG